MDTKITKEDVSFLLSELRINNCSEAENAQKMDKYITNWAFFVSNSESINESFSVESEALLNQIQL